MHTFPKFNLPRIFLSETSVRRGVSENSLTPTISLYCRPDCNEGENTSYFSRD